MNGSEVMTESDPQNFPNEVKKHRTNVLTNTDQVNLVFEGIAEMVGGMEGVF